MVNYNAECMLSSVERMTPLQLLQLAEMRMEDQVAVTESVLAVADQGTFQPAPNPRRRTGLQKPSPAVLGVANACLA